MLDDPADYAPLHSTGLSDCAPSEPPHRPVHNIGAVSSRSRDLRSLPKAHLHLHFEAAQRPQMLADLLERYAIPPLPPGDGTFAGFSRTANVVFRALRHPDDYVRLIHEMCEDAIAEGVVWLEPAVCITQAYAERISMPDPESVLRFLLEVAQTVQSKTSVGIGFMVAANRNYPPSDATQLARLAARYAGRGVVSFGLAGDEALGPAEDFAEAFGIARAAGLIRAPHGGEHDGPDSVRAALDVLGANRIAHGVRCIDDADLVKRIADDGVCLDVCPTSNVQLSVSPSLETHPLPALLDAGVSLSLNADDPVIFGCTLLDEYQIARRVFGLSDMELAHIAATSLRASGATEFQRANALARIDAWLAAT
jgi:adenosine deaminase